MKVQKKVAVVSARHLASLLVRLAVVLQTKNARAQNKLEAIANSIVKVLSVWTVPFMLFHFIIEENRKIFSLGTEEWKWADIE